MSDPLRPPPEVLGPRAVVRWLDKAEEVLANAQATTDDRFVADACMAARKLLSPARRRALSVLKDVDLSTAPQPGLFTEGGGRVMLHFRHLGVGGAAAPAKIDGRQLVGVLCVNCDSWSCANPAHRTLKRAVYIRSGSAEGPKATPRPHHEGTARYFLTAKGSAAVADFRTDQESADAPHR